MFRKKSITQRMSVIKYKVNHNPITYNHRTRMYEVGRRVFQSYQDAKASQWQCDKCKNAFSSFKELRVHKNKAHAY
jgi:hypothetical protein